MAPAAGLLVWRGASCGFYELVGDWIALLSILWIVTALSGKPKTLHLAAAGLAALLLGLYLWHQGPHALGVLGIGP